MLHFSPLLSSSSCEFMSEIFRTPVLDPRSRRLAKSRESSLVSESRSIASKELLFSKYSEISQCFSKTSPEPPALILDSGQRSERSPFICAKEERRRSHMYPCDEKGAEPFPGDKHPHQAPGKGRLSRVLFVSSLPSLRP